MMTRKFIPYARQSISSDDAHEVSQSLLSDLITRGPQVEKFEQALAEYCGVQYAVAFNSATAALMAAYHAAKVTVFDRLITTPNSFVATIGAAMQCGATPVFVDIDRATGNLDLDQVKINLEGPQSSRGRMIIAPVHFSGIAVDMEKLDGLIKNPSTFVIEDAAHAIGSSYANGQKVGSCAWSHMTIFSFHPSKTMTTGEGGMVTTNDEELARLLRRFRNNGIEKDPKFLKQEPQPWYYEVQELSGNYNVTELQAALGLSQLKRLEQFVVKRRQLVAYYRSKLKDIPLIKLFSAQYDKQTAFHLFVVQIDFAAIGKKRSDVMLKLKEKGIGSQVHYIPLYRHPIFNKSIEDISVYFPQMEAYYTQALSLPLYYDLTEADVDYICQTLCDILKK